MRGGKTLNEPIIPGLTPVKDAPARLNGSAAQRSVKGLLPSLPEQLLGEPKPRPWHVRGHHAMRSLAWLLFWAGFAAVSVSTSALLVYTEFLVGWRLWDILHTLI